MLNICFLAACVVVVALALWYLRHQLDDLEQWRREIIIYAATVGRTG